MLPRSESLELFILDFTSIRMSVCVECCMHIWWRKVDRLVLQQLMSSLDLKTLIEGNW